MHGVLTNRKAENVSTLALINQALNDQTSVDDATAALANAVTAKDTADRNLANSSLALYNDLTANGRVVVVDVTADPVTVTEYTPVYPNSFQAATVRVAN